METFVLKADIRVFGKRVHDFPSGIGKAFSLLVERIENGFKRSYYGISHCDNGQTIYKVAAEEMFGGEGKLYDCESFTIEKGEYIAVTVRDWRKKPLAIKEVCDEIKQDERADLRHPLVEWYKDDDEMVCMARLSKNIK